VDGIIVLWSRFSEASGFVDIGFRKRVQILGVNRRNTFL
jgi:hypothetical protein